MDQVLLKVEEAATLLRIGRSRAYMMVRDGELPAIKVGNTWRVPYRSLLEWVESKTEVNGQMEK